ncbi:MAG TPA: CHAD domain-containing protein [Steroidobacteraceae bacterium]|jgi:hypothetical protein
MRAAAELALTSAYHPCNQIVGILRGHVAHALTLLGTSKPNAARIHAARQELKRARATLRLLRDSIDPEDFRQEDKALREAARHLNDARDSEVVLRVFHRLRETLGNEPQPLHLEPLRQLLLHGHRNATADALREPLTAARTLLARTKERTRSWRVSNDLDLLTTSMQRTYTKGRDCFRLARRSHSDGDLHAWRRQVKYSTHQLEALGLLAPPRMRRRLQKCAKLAKVLGRDRDFTLLHQRIGDAELDAVSSLRLAREIARERHDLQARAIELGRRLYRTKPRKFQPLN